MPLRAVKQQTDRGSLKNLVHPQEAAVGLYQDPPTQTELRFKKLCEYAQGAKDRKMQQALGIITTDYISDKNALPLSVYRLRQIVADIKSRSAGQIEQLEKQFASHIGNEINQKVIDYTTRRWRIKTASVRKPPVFRRVSK
jgi:hypothetical protein